MVQYGGVTITRFKIVISLECALNPYFWLML